MELTMMKMNHQKVNRKPSWFYRTRYSSDQIINKDPCIALKEITEQIAKWSDEFMAECRSHKRNPQIPKKMEKIQNKMLKFLRSQDVEIRVRPDCVYLVLRAIAW